MSHNCYRQINTPGIHEKQSVIFYTMHNILAYATAILFPVHQSHSLTHCVEWLNMYHQFTIALQHYTLSFFLTRMWANAQRDGRPVEYRWCPLFKAAKFG